MSVADAALSDYEKHQQDLFSKFVSILEERRMLRDKLEARGDPLHGRERLGGHAVRALGWRERVW